MSASKLRTCLACGWVAYGVTREYATQQVMEFNIYFDNLTPEKQQEYYNGKRSTIASYERCLDCGGSHLNFRPAKEGDCPAGVTLNPIIVE